jgi:hypothetical protein
MKKNTPSISVVIATLGGGQLSKTIEHLNANSIVPVEILICIPEQYVSKVKDIHGSNVHVIATRNMGQVAQRAEGFRQTKGILVMQLDDDIELKGDAVQHMVIALGLRGKKNVVGPVYINNSTKTALSPYPVGLRGMLISLYYFLFGLLPFGKARMGCLSSICVSASIDPYFFSDDVVRTQWLAGGCVLSYRDDLILENFYPFEGKAYAEDGLHSYLRSKLGIVHNVVLEAHALIEAPSVALNLREFFREMYVRMKIVQMMQGSVERKIIYIIAEFVQRITRDIRCRWN